MGNEQLCADVAREILSLPEWLDWRDNDYDGPFPMFVEVNGDILVYDSEEDCRPFDPVTDANDRDMVIEAMRNERPLVRQRFTVELQKAIQKRMRTFVNGLDMPLYMTGDDVCTAALAAVRGEG